MSNNKFPKPNQTDSVEMKQRKFNDNVAFLWRKPSGNFMSMPVDARMKDQLMGVQIGDRIMVKIKDFGDKPTSANAVIERIDREQVAKFEAERRNSNDGEPTRRNPSPAVEEDVAL